MKEKSLVKYIFRDNEVTRRIENEKIKSEKRNVWNLLCNALFASSVASKISISE